jgi:SAM-dependent methyltransferase
MQQVLNVVSERLQRYARADISTELAETDVMYAGSMAHYLAVGRSAMEMIARAMLVTGKTDVATVLDLPCGGGRVTRHLIELFPDADLFVSDLDKTLETFTVSHFGGSTIDAGRDFDVAPPRVFDLIFVGSLVTHLDAPMFARALDWFKGALAPEGVLVVTTPGRRVAFLQRTVNRTLDPAKWSVAASEFAASGFGYVQTESHSGRSYGASLSMPSWVMRLVETDPAVRVAGFQEAAWDNHQDVLIVQKRDIYEPHR